jgi:hypothetical protein
MCRQQFAQLATPEGIGDAISGELRDAESRLAAAEVRIAAADADPSGQAHLAPLAPAHHRGRRQTR